MSEMCAENYTRKSVWVSLPTRANNTRASACVY